MIYAIKKNASGVIESVYAWTDDSQPIPSGCVACSADDYASYLKNLTDSVQSQAVSAQVWIQQQASLAAAMGEVFTTDMKAYVKAINAIASGADTTSTALPAQPADVMVGSTATA